MAISHIYKDACRLAQAKGLARQIYHEPALEVRFVRKANGHDEFFDHKGSDEVDYFRMNDITGQSLPVLMASRMMDVLWSDLHITHQSRSSKSGDSFIDLSAPPELKRS